MIADLTPAMLREGAAAARAEGRADVVFVQADAEALPFPDGEFEVVVSRFALHHMSDPGAAIGEMARACAPGGTVALVDMVADEGSSGGRQDELERLRDPSHTRCLADEELLGLMGDAGLEPLSRSERRKDLPVRQWLEQAGPSAENARTVTQALEAEAGGGPSTGLNGHRTDDGLAIAHRYLLAVARKRDGGG